MAHKFNLTFVSHNNRRLHIKPKRKRSITLKTKDSCAKNNLLIVEIEEEVSPSTAKTTVTIPVYSSSEFKDSHSTATENFFNEIYSLSDEEWERKKIAKKPETISQNTIKNDIDQMFRMFAGGSRSWQLAYAK